MATYLNIPVREYGTRGKTSAARLPVAAAIGDAAITSLFNAVDGVTIGAIAQSSLDTSIDKDAGPGGIPASPAAQVETKWLCHYHDATTGKLRTLEIPCYDSGLLQADGEFMDLAAGAGLTFKTQFDLSVVDPETGNATVLDSAEFVTR